jgi:hypothetical protein
MSTSIPACEKVHHPLPLGATASALTSGDSHNAHHEIQPARGFRKRTIRSFQPGEHAPDPWIQHPWTTKLVDAFAVSRTHHKRHAPHVAYYWYFYPSNRWSDRESHLKVQFRPLRSGCCARITQGRRVHQRCRHLNFGCCGRSHRPPSDISAGVAETSHRQKCHPACDPRPQNKRTPDERSMNQPIISFGTALRFESTNACLRGPRLAAR